jgi:hypothetical protein
MPDYRTISQPSSTKSSHVVEELPGGPVSQRTSGSCPRRWRQSGPEAVAARRWWGGQPQHELVRRWPMAVPGRVLNSGRRLVLRFAQGTVWATTLIAAYQGMRLLTSSA